jgi:general secretion pathway protein M
MMETLNNIQNLLQQRFNQLARKEQYYVIVLAVLLIPYCLYMLLWQPVSNSNQQLKQANSVAQQQLQTVQQLAQQYKKLKAGNGSNSGDVNLPQLIDSSLVRHKLSLKRMQPSASGDIQLRFEEVSFNHLVAWLYELESEYGVLVKDLSINPGNSLGQVSCSVRLRKS